MPIIYEPKLESENQIILAIVTIAAKTIIRKIYNAFFIVLCPFAKLILYCNCTYIFQIVKMVLASLLNVLKSLRLLEGELWRVHKTHPSLSTLMQ